VVRRILESTTKDIRALIGNSAVLRTVRATDFVDDTFGLPTVNDILKELDKPGRDPRPAFHTATFAEGVETLADLLPGMVLEGVVTNVAAFGAFVDVGVHSDGLVHVSAMSSSFVRDPREVVKPGDVVRVKVLGVDLPRKRISLTLRLDDEPGGGDRRQPARQERERHDRGRPPRDARRRQPDRDRRQAGRERGPGRDRDAGGERAEPLPDTALADALRRAGLVE
jgi:uncharacterized protein